MGICLKVLALSKSFDGLPILENWSLEVAKGERLALIGPSGCGKTTFLRIVAGLEKPSGGLLYLDCRRTGYVFQEPRLIPWKTVKENLLFACPAGPYGEILSRLDLAGFEDYFPSQLSGGMAQRVNLGRALMIEPDLLILDEAFFAIDLGIKYKIIQGLMDLWEERKFTLITVTHDPKDALFLADRILLLSRRPSQIQEEYLVDRGEAISLFAPDLLKSEPDLINRILRSQ